MSKIRRASAMSALVAIVSAGLLAGGASTASAEQWDSCDLRVKLDELKKWDAEDQYNIIVWKDDNYESANLDGVVLEDTTTKGECEAHLGEEDEYHWAVFESGEFTRKNDGGFRNWSFYGNYERPSDEHVVFEPR